MVSTLKVSEAGCVVTQPGVAGHEHLGVIAIGGPRPDHCTAVCACFPPARCVKVGTDSRRIDSSQRVGWQARQHYAPVRVEPAGAINLRKTSTVSRLSIGTSTRTFVSGALFTGWRSCRDSQ